MSYSSCPACSHSRFTVVDGRLWRCTACNALYGSCYRGDVYRHVSLHRPMSDGSLKDARHFDVTLLGSDGVSRVHGWYDPKTKQVLQVG